MTRKWLVCSRKKYALTKQRKGLLNPFVPNAPFLYPLKSSENLTIFWCVQGYRKGALGTNRLTDFWPIFHFYFLWKRQRVRGSLSFPGGYKNGKMAYMDVLNVFEVNYKDTRTTSSDIILLSLSLIYLLLSLLLTF